MDRRKLRIINHFLIALAEIYLSLLMDTMFGRKTWRSGHWSLRSADSLLISEDEVPKHKVLSREKPCSQYTRLLRQIQPQVRQSSSAPSRLLFCAFSGSSIPSHSSIHPSMGPPWREDSNSRTAARCIRHRLHLKHSSRGRNTTCRNASTTEPPKQPSIPRFWSGACTS